MDDNTHDHDGAPDTITRSDDCNCVNTCASATTTAGTANGWNYMMKRVWCNVRNKLSISRAKSHEQTEDSLILLESATADCVIESSDASEPGDPISHSATMNSATIHFLSQGDDNHCPHIDGRSYTVPQEPTSEDISLPLKATSEAIPLTVEATPAGIFLPQEATLEDTKVPKKCTSEGTIVCEETLLNTNVNNFSRDCILAGAKVIPFEDNYPKLSLPDASHNLILGTVLTSTENRANNDSGDASLSSPNITSQLLTSSDGSHSTDSLRIQTGASMQAAKLNAN